MGGGLVFEDRGRVGVQDRSEEVCAVEVGEEADLKISFVGSRYTYREVCTSKNFGFGLGSVLSATPFAGRFFAD